MKLDTHILNYLEDIKLMQLATCRNNKPWLCNVWYVMDEEANIYWMSRKTRRHSEDILVNPSAACTFHKLYDEGLGQAGQALVISGEATLVEGDANEIAYNLYSHKYPKLTDVQDLETFIKGLGPHYFYKIVPQEIVWWDEVGASNNPRQQIL